MHIEIWSDVVCPWCYIGKRRLEEALSTFEHRDQVRVTWRSYELDPTAPERATGSVLEHLGAKYGGGVEGAREMVAGVQRVAAEVGLDYAGLPDAPRVGTRRAHRLLHAAAAHGEDARAALKESLLHAYLVEGADVGDPEVLVPLATAVGVSEEQARAAIDGDHEAAVAADVEEAQDLGAGGVPFFVVDRRYGISGAQPAEVFTRALEQAWADRGPLQVVAAGDGGPGESGGAVCADGSCAVPE
ncbi:MAG: disulfide bond formation protein DsbA [Nocardioides sp.]|nr:disulfide bond formation protein DsbA [Nocardioides sp.]